MKMEELFQFEGDTYCFESAKVTNVSLSDEGACMNVTGHQSDYGIIYLTYSFKENPNHETQGSFSGKAVGIAGNGAKNVADLNGVWVRKEHELTMYSLDDVSDGNLFFALIKVSLAEETAEIYFSNFSR